MFSQFRNYYPQGSLISELVTVEYGRYVVRALARVDGVTLATSLASADTVEQAEDNARSRLFALLELADAAQPQPVAATAKPPLPEDSVILPRAVSPSATEQPPAKGSASANWELPSPLPEVPSEPPLALESPIEEASPPERSPEPTAASIAEEFPVPEIEEVPPAVVETVAEAPDLPTPVEDLPVAELPVPTIPVEDVPSGTSPSRAKSAKKGKPETSSTPMDFSDIIAQTNLELKRLGWTSEQGRKHLLETYGKRSRQLLTDEELVEFLDYLKSQLVPQ